MPISHKHPHLILPIFGDEGEASLEARGVGEEGVDPFEVGHADVGAAEVGDNAARFNSVYCRQLMRQPLEQEGGVGQSWSKSVRRRET